MNLSKKIIYVYAIALGFTFFGSLAGLLWGNSIHQQALEQTQAVSQQRRFLSKLQLDILHNRPAKQLSPYLSDPIAFQRESDKFLDRIDRILAHLESARETSRESVRSSEKTFTSKELQTKLAEYETFVRQFRTEAQQLIAQITPLTSSPNTLPQAESQLLQLVKNKSFVKFIEFPDRLLPFSQILDQREKEVDIVLTEAKVTRIKIYIASLVFSILIATIFCIKVSRILDLEQAKSKQILKDQVLELEQSSNALQQSELTKRIIMESMPDLVIQMDLDGRYLSITGGASVRVKRPFKKVTEFTLNDFMSSKLVEQRLYYAHKAVESGEMQIYEQEIEIEGDPRIEEVRLARLNDREVLTIVRDVTEQKQFEQQLQELNQSLEHKVQQRTVELQLANEELVRATRLKDEFLANMSHELRTPLNAVLGMTEGLQAQVYGDLNERQLKCLKTIESSGNHLLELINDILDLAKIESGQIKLEHAPTSIPQLCQSSLSFVKQQALKKQIQLHMIIPPQLPTIQVDERRIRQVLINLLNNAVKFTPDGGHVRLEVMLLTLESNQEYVRIKVTDTGIGIAPENIDKLFKPFIQIDSALNRKYEGTGLGLALVKQIVELHSGRVELTSELGVGSCFTVEFPINNPALSILEEVEEHLVRDLIRDKYILKPFPKVNGQDNLSDNLLSSKLDPSRSPLILLAEDNETNISSMYSYLEAKGYRIYVARDGLEAIAFAKEYQPDLILMDIQMPVMNGLDAIKQIRLEPNFGNTPIIALTALAMESDRQKCLDSGANEYITKPVRLQVLSQKIQTFLT
jgi:signal transduction histidine kinase/CheY-like chemotaxis protein